MNPFSASPYLSTLALIFSVSEPIFASPEMSPFISAKNTGTPKSENDSAKVFKVIVLPVPVAPAIKPCLLASFGNKLTHVFSLQPINIFSSAYMHFHPFSIFLINQLVFLTKFCLL